MDEYDKVEISFWYSEEGTPHIDKEDIKYLNENYLSVDSTKKIRESLRRTLKNIEKSFSDECFETVEGKLEIKIKR